MAMPAAKGLFQKAINESGSFRTEMLDKRTTQDIAAEVLKALNIDATNGTACKSAIPGAERCR